MPTMYNKFNVQTGSTAKAKISTETFINWLINQKIIPTGRYCNVRFRTNFTYASNDILQVTTMQSTKYELHLAGCEIEFIGSATAYNTGEFTLRIVTAPTSSFTSTSGYLNGVNAEFIYRCNGSSYSPNWQISGNRGIVDIVYPVGSVYISVKGTSPTTLFPGTTWTQLATGTSLWNLNTTDGNLGKTLDGSLPNIKDSWKGNSLISESYNVSTGVLTATLSGSNKIYYGSNIGTSNIWRNGFDFDASKGNSVYGAAAGTNVVRPTSIGVTMWKRTA